MSNITLADVIEKVVIKTNKEKSKSIVVGKKVARVRFPKTALIRNRNE